MVRWEWVGEEQGGLKCLNPPLPRLIVGAKMSPPPPMWGEKDLCRSKRGGVSKARRGKIVILNNNLSFKIYCKSNMKNVVNAKLIYGRLTIHNFQRNIHSSLQKARYVQWRSTPDNMFTAGFMNASLHCETADKNSNGVFKKRAPNVGRRCLLETQKDNLWLRQVEES